MDEKIDSSCYQRIFFSFNRNILSLLFCVLLLAGSNLLLSSCQSTSAKQTTTIEKSSFKNKETPYYYEEIAKIYYSFQEYNKAIKAYEKIIELFGKNQIRYKKHLAWAYYEIGFCYLIQKQYNKSSEYFLKVIKNYSDVLSAYTLANQRLAEIKKKNNKKTL